MLGKHLGVSRFSRCVFEGVTVISECIPIRRYAGNSKKTIPKSPGTSKSEVLAERTLKGPIAEKLCKCRISTAECGDLFDYYGS